jgi:hypothetical protein
MRTAKPTLTAKNSDEFVSVIVRDGRPGAACDRQGNAAVVAVLRSSTPVQVGDGVALKDGTRAAVTRVQFDRMLSGHRGPRRIQSVYVGAG